MIIIVKEGNINDRNCKDKKTVEIDFQSPGRDKTYYHKNIRLMLSKKYIWFVKQ